MADPTKTADHAGGGNNQGQRQQQRNGNRRRQNMRTSTSIFKGDVELMNGNVFQLHTECKKRGQFQDTLDALNALASTEYKKEVRYLDPLFRKLEAPSVPLPTKPEQIAIKNEDGSYTYHDDPVKMDIYREEIKAYVGKMDRLKHTETALYNIVWGQCSRLMKNKLQADENFEDIEEDHNVSGLLKGIRSLYHQIDNNIYFGSSICIVSNQTKIMRCT